MTNGLYMFDDLVHTPNDGQRYEVIDGHLVVTPMARRRALATCRAPVRADL
jgi:hypothetical protein